MSYSIVVRVVVLKIKTHVLSVPNLISNNTIVSELNVV